MQTKIQGVEKTVSVHPIARRLPNKALPEGV
jgi:hypothetical protein